MTEEYDNENENQNENQILIPRRRNLMRSRNKPAMRKEGGLLTKTKTKTKSSFRAGGIS